MLGNICSGVCVRARMRVSVWFDVRDLSESAIYEHLY